MLGIINFEIVSSSEFQNIIRVSNHPVHITDIEGKVSPSAFIPFCGFGYDLSSTGVKIDQFDVPVCNSFQAIILNGQLCYEVDLNNFSEVKDSKDTQLKTGFREGFKKKKKKKYGNFHTFADPPPPKVWKIIFYFFSIVDHYWRFFGNFEKFPKISKGGTLGIFLILDIFLKFFKFSQNIQRGTPP